MKEATIRFVEEKDLGALVLLCEEHAHFERADYSKNNKESMLKEKLFTENPSFKCLVVEHNESIVGYCSFMKQFSTWDSDYYLHMDCLFLVKEARGFGLGEILLNRLKEEANQINCKIIQWQTPSFNSREIKFYDRIGGKSIPKERYFLNL